MKEIVTPRDGAFIVNYYGSIEKWKEMEFLLGKRASDGRWESLGGGFELLDLTPEEVLVREVFEESGIFLREDELVCFLHMIQRVIQDGVEIGKGHVFCFLRKHEGKKSEIILSEEHTEIKWHKLTDILYEGEKSYRTSTLRTIINALNYLRTPIDKRKIIFGIFGEKARFINYEF